MAFVAGADKPANDYTESSPMGNGRLGAMTFGGVNEERILLNESSVWSGSRQDADRPDAYKVCLRSDGSRGRSCDVDTSVLFSRALEQPDLIKQRCV